MENLESTQLPESREAGTAQQCAPIGINSAAPVCDRLQNHETNAAGLAALTDGLDTDDAEMLKAHQQLVLAIKTEDTEKVIPIIEHLSRVKDHRIEKKCTHLLVDILVISLYAVICGADCMAEIAVFGQQREKWFRTFLKLPGGIPSQGLTVLSR